jgi:hypothetical protein
MKRCCSSKQIKADEEFNKHWGNIGYYLGREEEEQNTKHVAIHS